MNGRGKWSNVAERWHDSLERAIAKHRNTYETAEINKLVEGIPGIGNNAQFIQPSDHCVNVTNEGACTCAKTNRALFEQVRRGEYVIR